MNIKTGNGANDFVQAARQMESFFISIMMKSMRKALPKNGLFGGGQGEDTFTEMLDAEYSKLASTREKSFGIADSIIRKYSKYLGPTNEQGVNNEKGTK